MYIIIKGSYKITKVGPNRKEINNSTLVGRGGGYWVCRIIFLVFSIFHIPRFVNTKVIIIGIKVS